MKQIELFEDLIKNTIGPKRTVVNKKICNLLPPGENYMSDILKIDIKLEDIENGNQEDIHIVAKLVATNEFFGSTSYMAKNELLFYQEIIPAMKSFSEKYGIPTPSFFPKFMGGRLNLTGGASPDHNAVVLIENLSELGYENVDRHLGFNLETTKYILKDLASFHAIPIAMKLLEPQIFGTKIKANCTGFLLPERKNSEDDDEKISEGNVTSEVSGFPEKTLEGHTFLIKLLQQKEEYAEAAVKYEIFYNRMKHVLTREANKLFNSAPVEPYATLVHQDMWINNIMLIFQDGCPVNSKFIDFQACKIGSPVTDLLFFLFSSVQTSCLEDHLDSLITHYHNNFSDVLRACGCYCSQFSYDNFLKEIQTGSTQAVVQSIFMLPNVVFQKKGEMYESEKKESLFQEFSPIVAEKFVLLGVEAAKRGWI